MSGLTVNGFERKRLEDIKAELEAALRALFGEDIDRPESVIAQQVGTFVLPMAELWEEAENVYHSFDPDVAEGVSLDNLAALNGITRADALPTTVDAIVIGDEATLIEAGAQARNESTGDVYNLLEDVTIGLDNQVRTRIRVLTVTDATDYTITINGNPYTITSGTPASSTGILTALRDAINVGADPVTAEVASNTLTILADDPTVVYVIAITANLTLNELASLARFEADVAGPLVLPTNSLTEIVTPVVGWTAVDNLVPGDTGIPIESDSDFRLRRRRSVARAAVATVDALFARLGDLTGVTKVFVDQNNGSAPDVNGTEPQHIWAVVKGGDPAEIGSVIFQTIAGGIGTRGAQTETITSQSGQQYLINFDRPTPVDIFITVTLVKDANYPNDGDQQIKDALVAFGQSLEIGEAVRWGRLFTPINTVPGHAVTSLFIDTVAMPSSQADIILAVNEIANIEAANIVIQEA